MPPNQHVVVIGCGVVGLTNAVLLAEAGAGAHWRTHATTDEPVQCDWDVQTFKAWEELLAREREANGGRETESGSGLKMVESIHYWDNEISEDLWWKHHVKDYRELLTTEEPMLSIKKNQPAHAPKILYGATSRAFSINVPKYLLYLQERARIAGVIVFQSTLPTDGGLGKALATAEGISNALGRGKVDCFVNASGLGAMKLCNDQNLYPIRGQTVLVNGEAKATRTRYHGGKIGEGSTSYCIVRPGSGTTILGGTKEKGNWSPEPDPKATETILERCAWMASELLTKDGKFEVLSVQCGLRPGRTGGPRVERERVGKRDVIHSYGHAGGGYQNSVGSARAAMKLVRESIGSVSGEPKAKL